MNEEDTPAPLVVRAALASVATACFLLVLKGIASWETGSVAMLGSLADTGLDLIASIVTLYGVRLAATPADKDHRFGHGKAEALAALFQVTLIAASAVGIGWRAILGMQAVVPIRSANIGIVASIMAIVATILLVAYQRRIIRRTGSIAILADNVHYQSDVALNISVIVALVLEQFVGLRGADPFFGLLIALWLAYGAFRASNGAIDQLMDKEWPEEERAQFILVAAQHPAIRGIHDFRTRRSGSHDFAQFHINVAPDMTIATAHAVMDAIEAQIHETFPHVEILIHVDPEGESDANVPLIEDLVIPVAAADRA